MNASRGWRIVPAEEAGPSLFPPQVVCEVKALACQLPAELGIPLSRFSQRELRQQVISRRIVA